MVELVKDSASYLVISLPQHGAALGFAASKDFNGFGIDAGARFEIGQSVSATVAALPEPATGGICSQIRNRRIPQRGYCSAVKGVGMAAVHTLDSLRCPAQNLVEHGILATADPGPATSRICSAGGRMLLRVPLTAVRPVEAGRKRKRHEKVQPGSVVEGTVMKAHPLYVDVQLADGGAPLHQHAVPYLVHLFLQALKL